MKLLILSCITYQTNIMFILDLVWKLTERMGCNEIIATLKSHPLALICSSREHLHTVDSTVYTGCCHLMPVSVVSSQSTRLPGPVAVILNILQSTPPVVKLWFIPIHLHLSCLITFKNYPSTF